MTTNLDNPDKPFLIADRVTLTVPGTELCGKIIGILTRVDHTLYEVLWNEGSVTLVQPMDLKHYEEFGE